MKLICPNCGAQYAVDDRVIPESGRDVQCSNCGHTWFQKHPDVDTELAEELTWEPARSAPASRPAAPERPAPGQDTASGGDTVPEAAEAPEAPAADDAMPPEPQAAAPESEAAEADETGPGEGKAEEAGAETPAAARTAGGNGSEPDLSAIDFPPRQRVDESVLSVLREEAEREQAARRAESGLPEFQPDLGVPSPEPAPHRGTADYTHTAPIPSRKPFPDDDGPDGAPHDRSLHVSPRRGRLPDVEEITSTLEPTEGEAATMRAEEYRVRRRYRRGMRFGMGIAFFVFGLAALIYSRSDRIVAAVPETAESLGNYVDNVDAGRLWLDRALREIVPDSAEGDG